MDMSCKELHVLGIKEDLNAKDYFLSTCRSTDACTYCTVCFFAFSI